MDKRSEESFTVGPMVSDPQARLPLPREKIPPWKYHVSIVEWKCDDDHYAYSLRPYYEQALHFMCSLMSGGQLGFRRQSAWVLTHTLLLTSCVTLGKLSNH